MYRRTHDHRFGGLVCGLKPIVTVRGRGHHMTERGIAGGVDGEIVFFGQVAYKLIHFITFMRYGNRCTNYDQLDTS